MHILWNPLSSMLAVYSSGLAIHCLEINILMPEIHSYHVMQINPSRHDRATDVTARQMAFQLNLVNILCLDLWGVSNSQRN